ncbi:MAG TPA: sigma 54-interacting transcriptional regulator [Candidatus Acidoferrales bacterium]|nr:sigma 54-interacting transcriptional regulator [Candidatus Acidoferrales bacterium]
MFGRSEAMGVVHQKLEKVAGANIPVLLQGESGTGKEIIAKLIHRRSPWETGPFVKVNCPAIPGTLVESELFGYEKGAFTGANGTKPGRVEMAQNGTLFLDEIAELEMGLQAKLLQLLQDGQFCPIGAQEDKRIDVRVVCATNRNLEEEIDQGSFRQDLYYRINVVNIQLPSLRERTADIPCISDFLRRVYSEKFNRPTQPLSARRLDMMQRYHWPGNIRELENMMKRYVILGSEDAIAIDLSSGGSSSSSSSFLPDVPLNGSISLKKVTRQATREFEKKIILKTLQTHNWNRKRAASALNISYRALLYKLKEAGVPGRKVSENPQPRN